MQSMVMISLVSSNYDFNTVKLTLSEQLIVLSLLSIYGFAERRFWELYFSLKQRSVSLVDFWHTPIDIQKKYVTENICEAIKNHKKEYKNTDYYEFLRQQQISPIVWSTDAYPNRLSTIDFPPPVLYLSSGSSIGDRTVAVIGSRKMSVYGERVLQSWVPDFVEFGLTVVSGAAIGVDRTATECVAQLNGSAVVVLGCGHLAPMSHAQQYLIDSWRERGICILSGFSPKTHASKGSFLARNRVVAGLSAGVLVVEAAIQSGTLHTANWAAELGRPLMAVPGSVFNPFAEGTAGLVNQGGQLVCSSDEVMRCLEDVGIPRVAVGRTRGADVKVDPYKYRNNFSQPAQQILKILESGECQLNAVLSKLSKNWTTSQILGAITELELNAAIRRRGQLISL